MRGDADEIRSQGLCLERELQKSLNRVGMEDGVGTDPVSQPGQLPDGAHGTDFIIHHHNGHQNGVRRQGFLQRVRGDVSLTVWLQIGHPVALAFQFPGAIQNGVVLNGSGNDVLSPLAQPLDGAEDSPVIRLRAAGGEKHPVLLGTQSGSHLLPGGTQIVGCVDAEVIKGAGVAPLEGQRPVYSLHGFRTGLGGGGIIQIDHMIFSLLI